MPDYDDEQRKFREHYREIYSRSFAQEARDKHIAVQNKFENSAHPDMHRAEGGVAYDASGKDIRFALLVKNEAKPLGALVLRASGNPQTGRLTYHGLSLFTMDDLQFDKDGE